MTFSPSLLATQAVMRFLPAAPTPTPTPTQPASGGGNAGGANNPFTGMVPDFNFGADFNQTWQRGFVAFWALLVIGGAAFLLYAFFKLTSATGSGNPHEAQQSKQKLIQASLGMSGLVAFVSVIGVFFFIF